MGSQPPADIAPEPLIEEIRRNWALVETPRAERQKWDDALAAEISGRSVWNITDFNYGKCHSYVILASPAVLPEPGSMAAERAQIAELGGAKHLVLLKLSAVAPYYVVRFLRRTIDAKGQLVEKNAAPETPLQEATLASARSFAESRGMRRLTGALLAVLVPGAELELAEKGTVTVYNCLFEDQDNTWFDPSDWP